jgi:hypothetical protein
VALLDDVAAWLCAMVITAYVESGSEQALLILSKWIRVGYHLKELRSFNMFFAAMFGIQTLDTYETDEGTLLLDLMAELEDADAEALACVTNSAQPRSEHLHLCLSVLLWLLDAVVFEKIHLTPRHEMLMLMRMLALTKCCVRLRFMAHHHSYYHGLKALSHPQQAQKGFARGSFEAYQQALSDPSKQGAETLPWLLHGLDELEEHRRVSMSASVSEPVDGGTAGGGMMSASIKVHFSVCIEQWRITEKITGYQSMCVPPASFHGLWRVHTALRIACQAAQKDADLLLCPPHLTVLADSRPTCTTVY